jgi:phage-related minor tail protein
MTDLDDQTQGLVGRLDDLDRLATRFGSTLTRAFAGGIVEGRRFDQVLSGLEARLRGQLLSAALRPLGQAVGQGLESLVGGAGSLLSGLFGARPFARGGVFAGGRVTPFASGGVVASPTYFPMGEGGWGLMGEAGAEAIMPLARGADGRLGVRAAGGAPPVQVVMNVTTPDAESFRRSQAQISAGLARLVGRGQRST